MAFDPTKPVDHAQVVAAELRAQFTALNDKIAAVPAGPPGADGAPGEVTTQQLLDERMQHARNPAGLLFPLGLAVSDPPTQAEVQAVATRLDEMLLVLARQP